jgi:hypothetical protein
MREISQWRQMTLLLLAVATTGCVGLWHRREDPCQAFNASSDLRPFEPTRSRALAGTYALTVVSEWEDDAGRSVSGRLELLLTDSVHRFSELGAFRPRRTDDRPLWGWAELPSDDIDLPVGADPASRWPDNPGVLFHANGHIELGVWRGMDGSSVNLKVDRVSPAGFAGVWGSDLGIMIYIDKGRRLPNPFGHFCAIRR